MKFSFIKYLIAILISLVLLAVFIIGTPVSRVENPGLATSKTVEVRYEQGKYQLYRNGQPYYIKGAGGYNYFEQLKENGGNSIRVWESKDAQRILDEAQLAGLTVTLGLPVASIRQGFDYNDAQAVAKQKEEMRAIVMKYKDHPSLLMWGVGNELNYLSSKWNILDYKGILARIRTWLAVNDIAAMIHEVDPNHPTTTMFAGMSPLIGYIPYLCPNIDIMSINIFGKLPDVAEQIKDTGWKGPYVISEWGPDGYWETARTDWDVAIEANSTQKARLFLDRYTSAIARDTAACLGSYTFFWGVKQERTHTWFSLFLDSGEPISTIDALHYAWKGQYPANRSPEIDQLLIQGDSAINNVVLQASTWTQARILASDPEGDSLRFRWEILPDLRGKDLKEGGDAETRFDPLPHLIEKESTSSETRFKVPAEEGAYRLFVYVSDSHRHVATANLPFYVMPN